MDDQHAASNPSLRFSCCPCGGLEIVGSHEPPEGRGGDISALAALGQRVLTRTEVGRFGDGIGNEKTGETPKRVPEEACLSSIWHPGIPPAFASRTTSARSMERPVVILSPTIPDATLGFGA